MASKARVSLYFQCSFHGLYWMCLLLHFKSFCSMSDSAACSGLSIHVIQRTNKHVTVSQVPVHFPAYPNRCNGSFLEFFENLTTAINNSLAVAVVGSGNPELDSLTSDLVAHTEIPFINVFSKNYYNSKNDYSLNMAPTYAELGQVVVNLAVQLGCSRILLINYSPGEHEFDRGVLRTMEKTARLNSLVFTVPTNHEEAIEEVLKVTTRHETAMVVLDCKLEDAAILIQVTGLSDWGQFIWPIFLERNYNDVISLSQKYRLYNALAVRPHHPEADWLSDTSTLVNITLQKIQMQRQRKALPSDKSEFVREMLRQEFHGKTGFVKFQDLHRTGTRVEILRLKSSKFKGRETSQWIQVGSSVAGAQVTLQNTFWKAMSLTDTTRIKAVTIEFNPLLLMSAESVQEDHECLMDYPCMKYVPLQGNNTLKTPVKFCCSGLLIDILVHMLVKDLGVLFDLYLVEDGKFGSLDPTTGEWNGMVKDLIDYKADMTLAMLDVNTARETVIDFSEPFLMTELKIVTSSTQIEDSILVTFAFLGPFDGYLWLTVFATINIVLVITWFLEKLSPLGHYRTGYGSQCFGIPACMSYVWSGVFKVSLEDITPKSFSARVTSAVFSFATLIITSSYTANLAASLVQHEVELPVTGIRDPKFQNPPEGFKFGALSSSSHEMFFTGNEDPVYQKIGRNMKPHGVKSMKEGLTKIRDGDMVAFFSGSPFVELEASKIAGCPFVMLSKPITTAASGLAFPKGSKWKHPISQLILKYQRKDFFRKIMMKWFKTSCIVGTSRTRTLSTRLSFQNLGGLFLVCLVAIGVSLVFLVIEHLLHRQRTNAVRHVSNVAPPPNSMQMSKIHCSS